MDVLTVCRHAPDASTSVTITGSASVVRTETRRRGPPTLLAWRLPHLAVTRRSTTPAALTARETEVLALLRERLTNAEIAERLSSRSAPSRRHVSALLRKLGVADRRALARMAGPDAELTTAPAGRPVRSALPVPLTPFVGRAGELDDLVGRRSPNTGW